MEIKFDGVPCCAFCNCFYFSFFKDVFSEIVPPAISCCAHLRHKIFLIRLKTMAFVTSTFLRRGWQLSSKSLSVTPLELTRKTRRSSRRIQNVRAIVGVGPNSDGNGDTEDEDSELSGSDSFSPSEEAFAARARRRNDLLERLDQISLPSQSDSTAENSPGRAFLSRESQLIYITTQLPKESFQCFENYFSNPHRKLLAASIAILFGNFCATSATTIIGSVADWDPLAAAVLLVLVEGFTKYYFRTKDKSFLLRLANAFKVGLIYGMIVDAFKLST